MRKLAASLLLVACANGGTEPNDAVGGTDTGNPHDDRPGEEGTSGQLCDQTASELALDATTGIGVSAAELFSWVSGTHREALDWLESNASYGPEHGRSEITLEIEPLGAHFIDRRPAQRTSGAEILIDEVGSFGDPCADSIALDVRLHLSTAGGALNETLDTTLEARSGDYVTGALTLATDSLTGSFQAEVPLPPNSVARGAPKVTLGFALSPFGNTGQLGLSSEFASTDGQAVGQGSVGQGSVGQGSVGQGGVGTLARFPADAYCESGGISVAAAQAVRGVSVADVLERLNDASPARLEGSSATLELSFQSNAQRVCVALDGPVSGSTRIEFPGRATLRSSDQRIDGTIDVTLAGVATAGVLESSHANANAFLLDVAQAAAARARYAIQQPLDFSRYDGGAFEFSADVTDTEAVGALAAYGLDQADCVTNPPPPDPGGNGTPGCRGTDRIQLWNARWSKP